MAVRKTTLQIDEAILAEVREILGTKGIKDTVDAAFWKIRREQMVKDHIALTAELGPLMEDKETMWHGRQ